MLMKVLCIQDICEDGVKSVLEVGQVYTASNCPRKGYYVIQEHQTYMGYPTCYAKSRFIPLSDIDETEMVREKLEIQVLRLY